MDRTSAKELSHIILKENSIAVDTLRENENTISHHPIVLHLQKDIPVMVSYNTAWFNAAAEIGFYPDVYSKFN